MRIALFIVLVLISGCSVLSAKEDIPPIVSQGVDDFCDKVNAKDVERLINFMCLAKEFN